eukprot:gnl/TRDRNA2_/TRDRNA2_130020_c0_seq1.p1 gnl/TRDRNA2_/TRDRNA2_130020_c0~~gnl/TRDRNA2_/TRDRNA2_130020_c0_seq1.p1  ORF type:complete len:837 (-),score=94.49 gnl/TRDRNA2_/TRDRNA2_130020_c0_seq1:2-2512(-)
MGTAPGRPETSGLIASKKRSIIAKWQRRQLDSQLFAVVRHAARADGYDAFLGGARWTQTDDFRKFPFDPPLSDLGMEGAAEVASTIVQFAEQSGSTFHIVISSPYYRCIQTAAIICRKLGKDCRMMIDVSVGEVFGPSVMGEQEPSAPVRPAEHVFAECWNRGVALQKRRIGQWPTWPEDLRRARRRYASRFLAYLMRSRTARRNFVLVTHGDCVGAALSIMPSKASEVVERVDFNGCLLAKRSASKAHGSKLTRCFSDGGPGASSFKSVMPEEAEDDDAPPEVEFDFDTVDASSNPSARLIPQMPPSTPHRANQWVAEEGDASAGSSQWGVSRSLGSVEKALWDKSETEVSQDIEGWKVETHNITLNKKAEKSSLKKKVKNLATHTQYTEAQIEQLLGEMPEKLLGHKDADSAELAQQIAAARNETHVTLSTCSYSTLAFGASDIGCLSDLGSAAPSTFPSRQNSRIPSETSLEGFTEFFRNHVQRRTSGSHSVNSLPTSPEGSPWPSEGPGSAKPIRTSGHSRSQGLCAQPYSPLSPGVPRHSVPAVSMPAKSVDQILRGMQRGMKQRRDLRDEDCSTPSPQPEKRAATYSEIPANILRIGQQQDGAAARYKSSSRETSPDDQVKSVVKLQHTLEGSSLLQRRRVSSPEVIRSATASNSPKSPAGAAGTAASSADSDGAQPVPMTVVHTSPQAGGDPEQRPAVPMKPFSLENSLLLRRRGMAPSSATASSKNSEAGLGDTTEDAGTLSQGSNSTAGSAGHPASTQGTGYRAGGALAAEVPDPAADADSNPAPHYAAGFVAMVNAPFGRLITPTIKEDTDSADSVDSEGVSFLVS